MDVKLSTIQSNQATVKLSEESVSFSPKSYNITEKETTGTEIFIAKEKVTEKEKEHVKDKSQTATEKTKFAHEKKGGSFIQILGIHSFISINVHKIDNIYIP